MSGYYHCSVKMISRSEGRSAVACAAYRSGQTLHDERYCKTHDYTPRQGILTSKILAPAGAPEWVSDREQLWNRVERAEKRKDAQLARELELGLPHQVPAELMPQMVESFICEQLLPMGMVVDYAIHSANRKGDERNLHAHVMTTLRPIVDGDLSPLKDREACSKEQVERWRSAWADIQNRTFERLGVTGDDGQILKVDHRSYEKQGIDREATYHMGPLATGMEREGKVTEIGELNREILAANENRQVLKRRAKDMSGDEVRELLSQLSEAQQREQILEDINRSLGRDEKDLEL